MNSACLGQQGQANYTLVVNMARPTGASILHSGIEYVYHQAHACLGQQGQANRTYTGIEHG